MIHAVLSFTKELEEKRMPDVLTIREAAELTRLKTSTLYSYVESRKIPFLKVGSRVLFEKEVLNKWLVSHRVSPLTRAS